MANEPYVSAKFRVWAIFTTESGEIRFDDVISVSASFALNTIPTASLVVAVGKNAINGKPATIHEAQARLRPRDRVVVKMAVTHGTGDPAKLPSGTYTIFDGFFVGIGYQRSHNQANFVLHLTHWLDDLNNSSAINGSWFPSVPFDYAQSAMYERVGAVQSFEPIQSVADDLATVNAVEDDLWENVIKKLFTKLAAKSGGLVEESNPRAGSNDAALTALDRMPGDGAAYYKKLGFKLKSVGGENVGTSFAQYFTTTIGNSFVQNTFWAKLVAEYAAQFFFAISPAVKWAIPIPFCAGLRWPATGGKLIAADEYNYANFNSSMAQLIRCVELAYSATEGTNLPNPASPPAPGDPPRSYFYPCGVFPPRSAPAGAPNMKQPEHGMRLFKMAPDWAVHTDAASLVALSSAADSVSTADPATEDGSALPASVTPSTAAAESMQPALHLFAQHWFVTEVLQQRYGELSGPLRFDIAPGSIVKIMTPARDSALKSATAAPEFVIASVVSVSYVINSERATAGTAFSISHTKTAAEVAAGSIYAVSTPPLYKEAWFGGPLAENENTLLAGDPAAAPVIV